MTGKESINVLNQNIDVIVEDADWNPSDMSCESKINMVEVKAMFVYAKRKLECIAKREGHIPCE